MLSPNRNTRLTSAVKVALLSAGLGSTLVPMSAVAYQFDTPRDWRINWDNTVSYNLGFRVKDVDDKIGNNPNFHQSDYKFSDAGDIVTNRFSVLSEFNAIYQRRMGFRLSASAWKDFAYDSDTESNPGEFAPGLPYSDIQAYDNGRYSSHTDRFYRQGGEILDAFVFGNFDIAGKSSYLRIGQYTEYWGNALFFPYQAISYSQGALDGIKLATAPGTEAKELFLPRQQIGLTVQLNEEWALSSQYFFSYDANRLPDGGTFLGAADFLWQGPDNLFLTAVPLPDGSFAPFSIPHERDTEPKDINDNFGFRATWTPKYAGSSLGMYYRHFDEVQAWAPWIRFNSSFIPTSYRLDYNEGVDLAGISYDTVIGNSSTGFELSYRRGTALNSSSSPLVPSEEGGARGDVVNAIANVIVPLSRTPLWDTGTFIAELAYAHLLDVTDNEELYNGEHTDACPSSKWNGCSTRNYVGVGLRFEPQWLQALPGVDLSMPVTDVFGLYGNSAQLSGTNQGSHSYSAGLKASIRQKLDVTLAYNGYYSRTRDESVTPNGETFVSSGNGPFGMNDRDWVSLTLKTSF